MTIFCNAERLLGIAVVLVLLLCCGCSNRVLLTGKVTFEDDGGPLTNGIVCFVQNEFLARGHLDSEGTYRMSSTGTNDGLPKGTYKVYLVGAELVSVDSGGNSTYTPLVHNRYESADTSGLEFEVDGKTRRFDFQVERAAPARRR